MKLKIYGVKDTLACETSLLLTEKNDELMKRTCKALLTSPNPNPINSHTKDTSIYELGTLDTEEGKIIALSVPRFAFPLEELRQELLQEIRELKQAKGEKINGDTKLPVEEK